VIKKYRANIKSFNYLFNDSILTFETSNLTISEEDLFTAWVRQRAEEYIPKKVEEFALKLGFKYNSVKIKKLSAQWGSCSFDKNLSFNLKLMYFNRKVIDYVIIHELCHLKIMDHSKRFWNLVEKVMPDYNKYRLQLNTLIH
jgi:predicted metal-dependent hydrolase